MKSSQPILKALPVGNIDASVRGVRWVNSSDAFDILVCDHSAQLAIPKLVKLRAQANNFLFPIVWVGSNALPYVDITVEGLSENTFSRIANDVADILERLEDCALYQGTHHHGRFAILAYLYSRQIVAEPSWDSHAHDGVIYKRLPPDILAPDLIESLCGSGLLEKHFWRRTYCCNRCGSASLNVGEVCPDCGSSYLQEDDLIHHFPCGFQGAARRFRTSKDTSLVCPGCDRKLTHFGVDYDKPAQIVLCRNCNAVFEDPPVHFECRDCGASVHSEDAEWRDWFQYDLSAEGEKIVKTGENGFSDFLGMFSSLDQTHDEATFMALLENDLRTARRYNRPLSLFIMKFSRLNSPHGKGIVSPSTRTTIETLVREILRDSDVMLIQKNRLVVLCPETKPAEMEKLELRIRNALNEELREDLGYEFIDLSSLTPVEQCKELSDAH